MVEALVALGVLGSLRGRDEVEELARERDGVDHDALGGTGVDHHAVDKDVRLGGVERLVVDLAQGLAVHGVAPARAEALEVEEGRAVADLLVGDEGDPELRVGQRAVVVKAGDEGADLGDASLVVGAEQGGAVRADDVLAHELLEVGHLRGGGGDGLARDHAGHEVAALVVDHVRGHALARRIGRRVDVGAQPERGQPLGAGRRGEGAEHVGVLVHAHVLAADRAQLLAENLRHVALSLGGGGAVGMLRVGLRAHADEAHETLGHVAQPGLPRLGDGILCHVLLQS